MNERIKEKIIQIEQFLEELLPCIPETFENYLTDLKSKAACERYTEKIVEALVDTAYLVIREKKLPLPDDDQGVFIILEESDLVSHELSLKLQKAKGMRNFLAHRYGDVDDSIVYNALKEQFENDIRCFIQSIRLIE